MDLKNVLNNSFSKSYDYNTLGKGFFSKTYLSYNTKSGWGLKSLNIFERIVRKIFGLYKSTHLKTVISQMKIENNPDLPASFMARINNLTAQHFPTKSQNIPNPSMKIEEEVKDSYSKETRKLTAQDTRRAPEKFYTQDSSGRRIKHNLIVDPFQFKDKGIVCLPNRTALCGLVSFLQIFTTPKAHLSLNGLNLNLDSTADLLSDSINSMQKKIEKIASVIGDTSEPMSFLEQFEDQIQLFHHFGENNDNFENRSYYIECHQAVPIKDESQIPFKYNENNENNEYELIGIISSVPDGGHWYAQIPDASEKGTWYCCGQFASLSKDKENYTPIEDRIEVTAIVEKMSKPILDGGAQLLVYKKINLQ
jgi:hypothetical protein